MDARELKFDVDYVVKVDDAPFCKGTIVRRKLDEYDYEDEYEDDDYSVRFRAGNRVGYLCPDEVEEVPPVPSFAQAAYYFEIPPSDTPDVPQGHPRKSSHYQLTLLQPLEIMQRTMTNEEFIGFLKGNIIKYSIRGGHKDGESPEKDLTKVETYSRWLKVAQAGKMINPMID